MSHEIPQQPAREEVEQTPEVRLFNVDAMSGEQVIVLSRALWEHDGPLGEDTGTSDEMVEAFWGELRGMVKRRPEHLRNIVWQCVESQNPVDWLLAGEVANGLVHYDWPFCRDVLVKVMNKYSSSLNGKAAMAAEHAEESAFQRASELMRDELTPEQSAELVNAYEEAGSGPYGIPLEPAHPERKE
ncbi:hypothetical protein ACWDSJ_28935 [Nocardia sp. NPDC003482]